MKTEVYMKSRMKLAQSDIIQHGKKVRHKAGEKDVKVMREEISRKAKLCRMMSPFPVIGFVLDHPEQN